MKKILSLIALLMLFVAGGQNAVAATIDDLVAITGEYTFIADNITSNGTVGLTANTLYDGGRIFTETGNTAAKNKGSITFAGASHLNSLRLKNIQNTLIFKVGMPCHIKLYSQKHSSRGINVGSTSGGAEFGKQTVNTDVCECDITTAGVVYLSSFEGDFYFAGFEITPLEQTVTYINDAAWENVYAYAWAGDEQFAGDWPGTKLTANDAGEYTWSTTESPTNIIFNDGGSNQTADLVFMDGGKYNSQGRIITLNDYTATFTTDGGWETVYAYAWNGDDKPLGEWPGTEMTPADGKFTITIQAEKAPTNIIFHNNAGQQTPDLVFENGKDYEYMLNTYTATFTTDAAWETVNAYAWTTTGEGESATTTEFSGAWPGTALEAVDGVYTFTLKSFTAPANILFNGGDDNKKTLDMTFTNGRAYKWNTTLQPLFALEASEEKIPAGTSVDVKKGETIVATLTYGVEGGADFAAPVVRPNEEYAGFTAYTAGNGENGTATSGTVYTIVPVNDGEITAAVWLNGDKAFYITEDGTAMEGFNGIKKSYASSTAFTFPVKAGSTYKLYCTGSKLGFYGFDYTYDNQEPDPEVENLYIIDGNWDRTAVNAMAWNEEKQAFEFAVTPTNTYYFAVVTKQLTAEEEAADQDWSDYNVNYRYAIAENNNDAELNTEYQLQKINGTMVLAAGTYTISITKDMKMTITGEVAPPPASFEYESVYAVGAGTENWMNNVSWDPAAEANKMTEVSDDVWEITFANVAAGECQFKFAIDGTWTRNFGGTFDNFGVETAAVWNSYTNIVFTATAETQDITVRLDLTGLDPDTKEGAKFTVTTTAEVAPDTWTIAGSQEILGSGWDVTDANNDMTVGEDGITYTLVKENVVVKGGNFFYKVVKNHSWSNENYGKDGSWEENAELAIAAPGTYTVTFTFVNDETHALTAVAEMTAEPTIIIAGGFAQYNAETETYADEVPAFFGTAWDPTAEANKMTLNAESGKYEITFNNVELPGAGNINYKAVMNGNWDFSWGTNEGGNGYYWINEAGNYNVTFTFDPATDTSEGAWPVTCSAEKNPSTGINAVTAGNTRLDATQPIYNIAGQRVSANYRGVVIQNGRRFVLK